MKSFVKPSVAETECNYSNDYYGDQVCVLKKS